MLGLVALGDARDRSTSNERWEGGYLQRTGSRADVAKLSWALALCSARPPVVATHVNELLLVPVKDSLVMLNGSNSADHAPRQGPSPGLDDIRSGFRLLS